MIIYTLFYALGCTPADLPFESRTRDSSVVAVADHDVPTLPEPDFVQLAVFDCDLSETSSQPIQEKSLGEDWAAQTQGGEGELHGWGVLVHDWNGDGRWDIFLPQFGHNELYLGHSDGGVRRVSEQHDEQSSMGGAAADLNGDGLVDVLLGNLGSDQLLLNTELALGSLTALSDYEWSNAGGLEYRTQHVALGDGNGDGVLDIFAATFYTASEIEHHAPILNPNLLYVGTDHSFWLQQDWPAALEWAPANAGGWVDIDDDGQLELYVINDKPHSGYRCGVVEYQNNEWIQWDSSHGLDVGIEGMGLAWGDLNLDGEIDFGITGWSEHALLMGSGGLQWYEASEIWQLTASEARVVAWGIEFVDMDNDGDQDVLVAYGPAYNSNGGIGHGTGYQNTEEQYLSLYLNQGDHLELVSNHLWDFGSPGNFRGFVVVDWNLDGYPDVIARDISRQARYYESHCGGNKAVHISLAQDGPNPDAIGARIWVEHEGQRQFRDIVAGSSNISSSGPPVAYFGVGDAEQVDIWVRWPDGESSQLADVATQQWIELER